MFDFSFFLHYQEREAAGLNSGAHAAQNDDGRETAPKFWSCKSMEAQAFSACQQAKHAAARSRPLSGGKETL